MGEGRNEHLVALLKEVGLSYEGLARRVNEMSGQQGVNLTYDKSSVSHWVKGKRPRGITPFLIAEVLSQKLRRPVRLAEVGFDSDRQLELASQSLIAQQDLTQALEVATALGKADVDRRDFLYVLPFSTAAAAGPQRDWLLHLLEVQRHSKKRINSHQVDGIRHMMRFFTQADLQFGGDHARTSLVTYLTTDVIPLLQRSRGSTNVDSELFNSTAELYLTLGWMTYDIGSYGLAQRYLMQGLYLAKAAGVGGLAVGSQILSALSHIATSTGEPAEGVRLARVASHTAHRVESRPSLVRSYSMEARAHARLRNPKEVAHAISAAEVAQQSERGTDEPAWMSFQDNAYLANQMAYCFRELDDRANMRTFAEHSQQKSVGRQIVSNDCYRATVLLRDGDYEQACNLVLSAAELAGNLRSRIVGQIIDDFRAEVPLFTGRNYASDFEVQVSRLLA